MLAILLVTFPFFALVLCGYIAARCGWLPPVAIPGLNTFVLYFALPCLLYRFGSSTPIAQLLDGSLVAVYTACAVVMVGFTIAVTHRGRTGWNDASFGALVGAFPNTGYMGVPLLVALLGAKAAGPAIVTIVVDLVVTSSLCIALSRLDVVGNGSDASAGNHKDGSAGENKLSSTSESKQSSASENQRSSATAAAKKALQGVAMNPMPWAILGGALSSAFELKLPLPVAQTVGLLADAASPVALFTIGAVLARSQANAAVASSAGDYLPVVLIKLVLHPVLLLLIGLTAIRAGLPLDQFALTVVVLVAALPSASNVALLAERFDADSGRIARIILLSTVLAFFTFSGAVALLT